MKKIKVLLASLCLLFSTVSVVNATESTTTITTTIPAAQYTLSIPATQEIEFNKTDNAIEILKVTDSTGFGSGKNLKVTVDYEPLKCETTNTTIDYQLSLKGTYDSATKYAELDAGDFMIFKGSSSGQVSENPNIELDTGYSYNITYDTFNIRIFNWGKALAGDYSSTITFTAEVVVEE